MKRSFVALFFFFLLFCPNSMFGQNFTIQSSSVAFNDLSAQTMSRTDLNGVKCALIKIRCVLDGMSFKGNVIGNVDYKEGEYWVYMSNGSKAVSIFHPNLLPLDVDLYSLFKSPVKSANTYIITLALSDAIYSSLFNQLQSPAPTAPLPVVLPVNSKLSGLVTDMKNGEPLIGCTIFIKNSNRCVVCDIDGKFNIDDIHNGATLIFSYVGYKRKEVTFTGDIPLNLDISLKSGKGVEHEDYFYDASDNSKYFDLEGNELPDKPLKKGTYIRISNGKPETFSVK